MNSKVNELLEIIKHHNEMYRAGTPEVPDSVYDREVEMLRELDPDNDWFKAPEPAKVRSRRKSALPIPMKSLNKVKDLADLKKWAASCGLGEDSRVVIMPKFDGLSLLCNEKTREAWSRGGAENEGQDCTDHLAASKAIHCDSRFPYTYGEFVFNVRSWIENFTDRINPDTGKPYKSPRNTAAGLLNRDEPSDLLYYVDFYRYGTDPETTAKYTWYFDLLLDLCDSSLQTMICEVMTIGGITEENLTDLYKRFRKQYYIDGLVIYIDEIQKWDDLGRHETTGNPRYAVAYKHPDFTDTFETTVQNVNWKVSKAGALKPVVNIETVNTGDCEMNNPTGYNAAWIKNKRIARGARVIVTRSGGVIPKILETLTPAPQVEFEHLWDGLSLCPHCGSDTRWNENHVELCCTNPLCPGIRLAKIVFFYTTCGAENMGEETITKMFEAGFTTLSAMLNITIDELLKIESFGPTTAQIIRQNNERILRGEIELPVLMQASDCFPGIGKVKAEQILESLHPTIVDAIYKNVSPYEYSPSSKEIDGMPITMKSFWNGLPLFYSFRQANNLHPCPPKVIEVNQNGKYAGYAVCFSGVRDKNLEEEIKREGGAVVSGVTAKTTHLIVKDIETSSNKAMKAKLLGVKIMTLKDFIK